MTGLRNVASIAPQLQSPVTQLNGDYKPLLNSIDDVHAADFTSGNVTLTLAQAQAGVVTCTGASAPRNLIFPHGYTGTRTIVNGSGQTITVKTDASGTTVPVANGKSVDVLISGNDVAVKSGVGSLSVTAPITDSGTSTAPVVGIGAATSGAAGSMSAADKAKLDAAASANTNSVLVVRDSSGRAQFTDPSASQDAATKASVAAAIAAAIVGADTYKGTWNATTNSPALVSSTGTQGWHYRVATAGTTALDGISDWAVGDWAYYDGTAWQKVDNSDQVVSVNGQQGAVVLGSSDVGAQPSDAKLSAIAALTWAADKLMYFTGAGAVATADLTAAARSFLASVSDSAMRSYLGLVIGSTVQSWSSLLDAWALKTAPSGTVVGDSDSQALTNKTINGLTVTTSTGTLTIPAGVVLTGPATSGTAMTLGNVETVTGAKTFGDAKLLLSGATSGATTLKAAAIASTYTVTLPAATTTLVGTDTTDTLTNKTLTTPTIASFTNATHTHQNAAGGGTLDAAAIAAGVLGVARGGSGAGTLTGLVLGNGTSAFTTVTAPSGTVVGTSDAQTLSNKRRQPRVYSAASTATLTPEIDTYDLFHLTAQAAALTIANHSTSTPADGEQIKIRLLDDGTARAISFGTNYVAKGGIALPTTTVLSKNMEMLFEWNANLSKYNLMALAKE